MKEQMILIINTNRTIIDDNVTNMSLIISKVNLGDIDDDDT